MKTVTLNGLTYAAPFADRYRPLSVPERETLAGSIALHGVLDPVHTYDSPAHGPAVIDGVNRSEIAAAHKLTAPVKFLGAMSDADAERIADEKHLGRRNLSPEEYGRIRAQRVARVAEKRADGKSTRQIADEEGVSQSQIVSDIKRAGEQGCSPRPETVTGRDGKTYPAQQPRIPTGFNPDADEPPEGWADDPSNEAGWVDPDAEVESAGAEGYAPEPSPAPRPRLPSYFKPGNNADPDHRYAELMQKVSVLGAQISKAINESFDAEGQESKLYRYLFDFGMVHARDKFAGGRHQGHVFVWLRGLRRLIKLAGYLGKHKPKDKLQAEYDSAMGEEETT